MSNGRSLHLPSVTFIVPARNEEGCIGACVDALRDQIGGFTSEIVVVDNGSSDATAAEALAHGARVVAEPNPGLANARQAGALAATGEILIYVDADSRLPPGWAASVVAQFNDPRLAALSPGFAFHDGRWRDDAGVAFFRRGLCPLVDRLLRLCGRPGILIGSAIAVRAQALRDAGGVDLRFQFYGEDTALARRLHRCGIVRYASGPIYLTSARRYQRSGLLSTVARYFVVFLLIQIGLLGAASRLAGRFEARDRANRRQGAWPTGAAPDGRA